MNKFIIENNYLTSEQMVKLFNLGISLKDLQNAISKDLIKYNYSDGNSYCCRVFEVNDIYLWVYYTLDLREGTECFISIDNITLD